MWSTPLFHFANTRARFFFAQPSLGTSLHRNGVLFLIKYKFYLWSRFATSSWWISPISLYFAHTPLGKTTLVFLYNTTLLAIPGSVCRFAIYLYLFSAAGMLLVEGSECAGAFLIFQLLSDGLPAKERKREIHNNISSSRGSSWSNGLWFTFCLLIGDGEKSLIL